MMVNTKKKRKNIKENRTQGTILREESNFMIEEQFEEPQQSKIVLWHKACN